MIGARELHVWTARIDVGPERLAVLSQLLDGDERARAARFRFDADRDRSTVARGVLRTLLGRYLDREPRDLRFVTGAQGKPALEDGALEFNVSHSGDVVLLAFARDSPVGIDVESEHRSTDLLGVAQRFFSPAEADAVRHAENVAAAFYRTWTAKESLIKAVGGGLSIDLASFRVVPRDDHFTPVENFDDWFVRALPSPGRGYHAAVAVRGDGWSVHRSVWR